MHADAEAVPTAPGSNAAADAFVDPFFYFDAGVDTALYAFRFSEGVGNARPSSVPLPAPIGVFCTAILMLAVRSTRRR
jgi:hypothetical protein